MIRASRGRPPPCSGILTGRAGCRRASQIQRDPAAGCTASASAAHQLRKLRFWPSRPWSTTTGRRSLPFEGALLTISAEVRICGVVVGVTVVVVVGSVEVMAATARARARIRRTCIVASRLSYECLCGDVSQSVTSWRDVSMLLRTMQRLVAMRARGMSCCLVTNCSGLPNSCASETE